MALGNANTSAQSRGKNKSILVKRRKEVVLAKTYGSISGTTVQARAACNTRDSLSETYLGLTIRFTYQEELTTEEVHCKTVFTKLLLIVELS